MIAQFYDLSSEVLEDGTIRLEQRDYCGEPAIIDAHPQQIIHIASGLAASATERHPAQASGLKERIATLERRLCWMRDRFEECHAALPMDFYERCAEAFEFGAWLDASVTVAGEYCADFPHASSIPQSNATSKPQEVHSLLSGDGSLPSAAGCANGHPEQSNGDLFPVRAEGKQDGG